MMDIGKDLQDAYECGRQDALTELMEYTYGMLTAEKFGLQHRIKSMMADRKTENSSEKPNNCDTCKHYNPDHEAIACERCLDGKYSRYEPKTEPQTEERQELEAYRKCIKSRSFWDAKHCDDCRFYDDCPFNEREEDALQTYCDTCKHDLWNNPEVCGKCVGSTTLGRNPRMYEPKTEPLNQDEPRLNQDEPTIVKKYDTFCGVPMAEAVEVMQRYKAEKTEPQTEPTTDCRHSMMTLDDAYYLVYKDLTKEDGLLTGKYDAKNGSKQYMNGVWSVMELIAYGVGVDCYEAFNERYSKNMVESMERAERSNE